MACRSKGMVKRQPGKAQGMRICRMPCWGQATLGGRACSQVKQSP